MHVRDDDRLSIQLTQRDGVAVLALRGEIDSFTAPRLRESVEAVCKPGVPVVLDMALVTFMDSSGVSALISAAGTGNGHPLSVQITKPSNQVRRVLSLTGLDKILAIES